MEFQLETIQGAKDGPHLLIVAGVHGDEFEPMVAVNRIGRRLRRQDFRGRVTLIPVLNESARGLKRRTGSDSLDLARTFPGRADGTITERVAYSANQLIHSADYFIDMHTGGTRLRLWPLSGYLLHPNAAILERQRQMARAFNLPVVWGTDPHLNGRTLSAARDANVPAIYVEYLGAAPFCKEAVRKLSDGCLQVMAEFGMVDLPAPTSEVRFWAEDARAGAGHLQVCQPAPHAGVFECSVRLGERVNQGQILGWLCGPVPEQRTPIVAEDTGHVVCLMASGLASPGEGLAVIAEFKSA